MVDLDLRFGVETGIGGDDGGGDGGASFMASSGLGGNGIVLVCFVLVFVAFCFGDFWTWW